MADIWAFLYQTSSLAVTALVLLVVKRLFLDKLSPRWQYGVWALLGLRALLPAGLLDRALVPGGRVALETAKTWVERGLSSALTDPYGTTQVWAPVPIFPRGLPAPGSITDLLFYLYAAGVAVLLIWFLLSYVRLRRAVSRGEAPGPEVTEQIEAVAARYGLRPPKRVAVLSGVESAFVCDPLQPVLVLPDRAVDDKVLLHELLHLAHGDVWAGVGVCLLRCLHWCDPLIWWCCDRIQNDCEALCDQRVLERLEGEERRQYGVILLSMADDRYARSPGTSSMANGGRNIKARIGAIARFKRYPRGMALASGCVAAVLALTCLVGTGWAAEVPRYDESGPLAQAKARLARATTPAGALDTYAKALQYSGQPLYLSMVAPDEMQAALYEAGRVPFLLREDQSGTAFNRLGYSLNDYAWQFGWEVLDFIPDGEGGYRGLLLFRDSRGESPALSQVVRVYPDGGRWLVEPQEELSPLEVDSGYADPDLPTVTYTAEEAGLRIEIECRHSLGTGYSREEGDGPQPHIQFTEYYHSVGGRAYDLATGREVSLGGVEVWPLDSEGERGGCGTVVQPPDPVDGSGGGTSGPVGDGVGLDCVAALELSFTYDGRHYVCAAYPEVTPYD